MLKTLEKEKRRVNFLKEITGKWQNIAKIYSKNSEIQRNIEEKKTVKNYEKYRQTQGKINEKSKNWRK